MKIFITGGHGFIGRNLKLLLTDRGNVVHAPSHEEIDILNYEYLEQYLRYQQFDAIIHTAVKGGRRTQEDTFENTYIPNIQMFENIAPLARIHNIPLIMFGSGAEFDRRNKIVNEYASSIAFNWPIDPYGLSKNILSKRALYSFSNIWILRLFGCFNYDEDKSRFIKNSILRLKNGLPIEIHNNKLMDFFFLDDMVPVIENILSDKGIPKNINLVYKDKVDLLSIASLIHRHCNIFDPPVNLMSKDEGHSYTGNGKILDDLNLPLVGLEEGIRRTCQRLL